MTRKIGYTEYQPLLNDLCTVIQRTWGDQLLSIILYGSVARGEARPQSDVDLLLIVEEASPVYWKRLQPLLPILQQLRQQPCWKALEAQGIVPSLNIIVMSRAETDQNRLLFLDMIEDARLLVDRKGYFRRRLEALQARLKELGSRKVRRNGTWYWDIKPDLKVGEGVVL